MGSVSGRPGFMIFHDTFSQQQYCWVSISGSGSVGPVLSALKTGTEPWKPGTLEPAVGLQSWANCELIYGIRNN